MPIKKNDELPDISNVFRNIKKRHITNDWIIKPNAIHFRPNETYLSVNWDRYCKTPKDSLKCFPTPIRSKWWVVKINIWKIKKNSPVKVLYYPNSGKNNPHSWIFPNEQKEKTKTLVANRVLSISKLVLK